VPGFEEFGDDGRTDVSGRAGNKDVHGRTLLNSDLACVPSSQ
jgi:hypothetical protein